MSRDIAETLPTETKRTLLVFRVADQHYAIPASDVAEILPMAELQRAPGAPRVLAGFLNLAGELIPVVRLHHLFGLPESEPELWTPLLILRDCGRRLAVWVDSVQCTFIVSDDAVLPLPSQQSADRCVVGVVRHEGSSLSLLSPQRLLLEQENLAISELRQAVQQRIDSLQGAQA